jgi:hypothetical protein
MPADPVAVKDTVLAMSGALDRAIEPRRTAPT